MVLVPRILVVDESHELARIVRSALALLDRQHILVEVPTAANARQELAQTAIDLVVTAHALAGEVDGVELARAIVHESLRTRVIVVAEPGDPDLDPAMLADTPFQYYVRPVAETFLRGLRVALDGHIVAVAEEQPASGEGDLGPVPPVNVEAMRPLVSALMRDVGAMGIIVADRTGRVVIDQGATGYIDREELATLLGPGFARATGMGALIGGNAWSMQYYDGERMDVFGLALGVHYFMCLIFDGAHRGAFGAVRMFGRRAADEMIELMGEAAYRVRRPQPPAAAPSPQPTTSNGPAPRAQAPRDDRPTALAPSVDSAPAAVDIDMDVLFGQAVDEDQAAVMFDPDALTELSAAMEVDDAGRLGYDQAVDLGILDE